MGRKRKRKRKKGYVDMKRRRAVIHPFRTMKICIDMKKSCLFPARIMNGST